MKSCLSWATPLYKLYILKPGSKTFVYDILCTVCLNDYLLDAVGTSYLGTSKAVCAWDVRRCVITRLVVVRHLLLGSPADTPTSRIHSVMHYARGPEAGGAAPPRPRPQNERARRQHSRALNATHGARVPGER